MTANYPASILPPNATSVERAIDRASAAALERLPVYLIRWVKDPDSCPLALLPWLAWEYQVDTWNINWSEQKKRDAIKRAHYIHRHRGTVAAVRWLIARLVQILSNGLTKIRKAIRIPFD